MYIPFCPPPFAPKSVRGLWCRNHDVTEANRGTGLMVRLTFVVTLMLSVPGTLAAADARKPIKVFILAGQSNMEGKAKVSLLEFQAQQPATRDLFKHLRKAGKWIERE